MGLSQSVATVHDTQKNTSTDDIIEYLQNIQFDFYNPNIRESQVNGQILLNLADKKELQQHLTTSFVSSLGISDVEHQTYLIGLISRFIDEKSRLYPLCSGSCLHRYVVKWTNDVHEFRCADCYDPIENTDRLQKEIILLNAPTEVADQKSTDSGCVSQQERGVSIGWLVAFTTQNDCWHMTTAEVRRRFVMPATASKRCRFVELPGMETVVGPAQTFISHCWGALWGDLVAAVADGADYSRRVWVDIFAVRQWPSLYPDLDFTATIRCCSSLLLVCSSFREVTELDRRLLFGRDSSLLPKTTRSKISFFRVWCLAEIHAALQEPNIAVVIKVGNHRRRNFSRMSEGISSSSEDCKQSCNLVDFVDNKEMLKVMFHFIDLNKAEATVQADRDMIFAAIHDVETLNRRVRGLLVGSGRSVTVDCAALGDRNALDQMSLQPANLLHSAAAGRIEFLAKLLCIFGSEHKDICDDSGATALLLAAQGGHFECLKVLLDGEAPLDHREQSEKTAVMLAADGGYVECLELLLERGANIADRDINGATAVMFAAGGGHIDCLRLLLARGASVNDVNKFGQTAMTWAVTAGHINCARLLLDQGASASDKIFTNKHTSLILAVRGNHVACVELLLARGAAINATNSLKETALMSAAQKGHIDCLQLLLNAGARVTKECSRRAVKNGNQECADLLTEAIENNNKKSTPKKTFS